MPHPSGHTETPSDKRIREFREKITGSQKIGVQPQPTSIPSSTTETPSDKRIREFREKITGSQTPSAVDSSREIDRASTGITTAVTKSPRAVVPPASIRPDPDGVIRIRSEDFNDPEYLAQLSDRLKQLQFKGQIEALPPDREVVPAHIAAKRGILGALSLIPEPAIRPLEAFTEDIIVGTPHRLTFGKFGPEPVSNEGSLWESITRSAERFRERPIGAQIGLSFLDPTLGIGRLSSTARAARSGIPQSIPQATTTRQSGAASRVGEAIGPVTRRLTPEQIPPSIGDVGRPRQAAPPSVAPAAPSPAAVATPTPSVRLQQLINQEAQSPGSFTGRLPQDIWRGPELIELVNEGIIVVGRDGELLPGPNAYKHVSADPVPGQRATSLDEIDVRVSRNQPERIGGPAPRSDAPAATPTETERKVLELQAQASGAAAPPPAAVGVPEEGFAVRYGITDPEDVATIARVGSEPLRVMEDGANKLEQIRLRDRELDFEVAAAQGSRDARALNEAIVAKNDLVREQVDVVQKMWGDLEGLGVTTRGKSVEVGGLRTLFKNLRQNIQEAAEDAQQATPSPAAVVKEPWEMSKKEWQAKNPQGRITEEIGAGSNMDRASQFDALPDSAEVTVFHATSNANADALISGRNILPELQGQGIVGQATEGIYVGTDPISISGMGPRLLAITAKKNQIVASPEYLSTAPSSVRLGSRSGVGQALLQGAATGGVVKGPPISVIDVTGFGRTTGTASFSISNAHEIFVAKAVAEGKDVPQSILKEYPDLVSRTPSPAAVPEAPLVAGPLPAAIPGQLALPLPRVQRTLEGAIPMPGDTPRPRGPVSPVPEEPSLVIVTARNPLGERWVFANEKAMEDAALKLGQQSDIRILPGNATAAQVDSAARFLPTDIVSPAEVRTPIRIRRNVAGQDVAPRIVQRQLPGRLETTGTREIRQELRRVESQIDRMVAAGPRGPAGQQIPPGSREGQDLRRGFNQDLQNLRNRAEELKVEIARITEQGMGGPVLPPDPSPPTGVIRREPVRRITPLTQPALGPGVVRTSATGDVAPGVQRISRPRGREIPFEASTPEEAAAFRAQVREPSPGQRTVIEPPEEVFTRSQAQENINAEFYDAVMDSPTDIAATAYLRTGKISEFIDRIPDTFEVATTFASEVFREVGRLSAKFADPTRTIQAIDQGYFGGALQRGLLWPTRRTVLAANNWGDVTKIDFRKMLDRHGIRSNNPIRTRQKLDAAGDILEEIGTNEVNVSNDILVAQFDTLLKKFSAEERLQIVGVAKESRVFFDNVLDVQNAARAKRGQSPIAKLQNYRPWIRNQNVWSRLGMSDLPARTISQSSSPPDFIKPNTAPNPRALIRKGGLEDYEKIRNIEKLAYDYVETARKDIFYTNIIQNGKAHIKALRTRGGLEDAAASIEDWIMESFAGIPTGLSKSLHLPKEVRTPLLALRRSLTRAVFPLNWTWNTFIQTSSASLTLYRYGITSTLQGLEYLARPSVRKAVHNNAYSAILKRRGAGKATLQDIGPGTGDTAEVQRSAVETVESYANFLTNIIEDNLTGISVQAAYRHGHRQGLRGRALWEFASEGGAKTQSMYNLEDLPGILRTKEVGAVVPFQTFAFEIMNTVRETGIGVGRMGADRTHRNRLVALAHWFGAMMAFNAVAEAANNRQPWQLSSFVPFWSVMTMGLDAGNSYNLPLPIKYGADLKRALEAFAQYGDWKKLRSWAIRYHMIGGSQIDKTLKGIEAVADGEVTDVKGDTLFEVPFDEWMTAISQGPHSTSEGKEYIDKLNESKGPIYRYTGIRLPKTTRFYGETPIEKRRTPPRIR